MKAFLFVFLFLLTVSLIVMGIYHVQVIPLYSKFLWGAAVSALCLVIGMANHDEIEKALRWERRQR